MRQQFMISRKTFPPKDVYLKKKEKKRWTKELIYISIENFSAKSNPED